MSSRNAPFSVADCNDLFSAKVLVRAQMTESVLGVERSMVSNVYDVKIERCGLVEKKQKRPPVKKKICLG